MLLRALEPLEGIPLMQERRGVMRPAALARGPGCLTIAMGVGFDSNGADLCGDGPLWLGRTKQPAGEIGVSVRIGITRCRKLIRPLRFYERGNPAVSGSKRLNL